jgi:asparagine synthase (glutamine-hydrolysing)
MSAIFAAVGAVTDAEVSQIQRLLAHRGPEAVVVRHGDRLVLGAIAREPGGCVADSGDHSVVCDATLYNRTELLGRLRDAGCEVEADSSAEIVLGMYRTFGAASLEEIDGDFAFVLVDRATGEVLVGRDYFGCRPLYYTRTPSGTVAFATEYKGLLALKEVQPRPDRDMVQYLQHAKRLPVGRTLLSGIHAAQIGGLARMGDDGRAEFVHRFAPLEVRISVRSEPQAVQLIREKLTEAIRRRSADADPIGLALSGGIDSISLAFLFRKVHPDRTIHTFTAGHGPDDPEIVTAAKVAERIGSIHHEVLTPPDLVKRRFREMVWHLEDPFARSEALQLHEVGRAARRHVDVLFSGQGSDGLFAGAPKYQLLWLMRWLPPLRGGLTEFYHLTQIGVKPAGVVGRAMEWAYFRGKIPPVPRVLGCDSPPRAGPLAPIGPEFVNRNMAKGFQEGVCRSMQKFERGFGAFGLDYRSPFYDLDLVRSAYSITDALKIRRGQVKYVFRRTLADLVPDEFRQLAKFPQRMRYDAVFADALDEVADEVLGAEAVSRRGLFEGDSIARLRRRTPGHAYAGEAAMRLWTAVATEVWARQFVDGEGVDSGVAGASSVDAQAPASRVPGGRV